MTPRPSLHPSPHPPPPLLELRGVSRTYQVGDQLVHALVDVDESIPEGDYVAIMGPSGSGKSTLLNVLGCLDRPDAGVYRFAGREVQGLADSELTEVRRHGIGFVFQFFHLVPRLTAAGNVDLPLLLAGLPRAERARRVAEALEAVGLTDRAHHRPEELSGGQRQRVAIARATIMRPKVLLADEPTGNLDTASGVQVIELLEELNRQGITLVVVSHDPHVARRARRVLVLVDGRVARRLRGEEIQVGILPFAEQESSP
ncbi:MAG TPA: ABC transporter ATP-binding protein [Thermoanaerobaculia bacterium]|nr:ABC transporter ATP-binding protein [Thermoanaerobaculia bacterium]